MKRGLCCVCAVLLCTALVLAGSPTKPVMDQKTGDHAVATTAPPVQPRSVSALDMAKFEAVGGLANRAPEGFVNRPGTWPSEATGRAHEFECSPEATDEGEGVCYDEYQDTYNGGCNFDPPTFTNIAAGTPESPTVILGLSGTFLVDGVQNRDLDWYEFNLTEDSTVTATVLAEFPVVIWLVDYTAQDCGAIVTLTYSVGEPCRTAVVQHCVPAGHYLMIVGPATFDGVACGAQYCAQLAAEPCVPAAAPTCPAETSYPDLWQLVYSQDEPWHIFVSNSQFPDYNPDNGILLYEHYTGIGGQIEDLHWWGVGAAYNDQGNLAECPLDPAHFHVAFWAHNEATNRPLYEPSDYYGGMYSGLPAPLYEFDVDITGVETGNHYISTNDDGSVIFDLSLLSFECELPLPLTTFEGWISIQNTDACGFWWAGSPGPPAGGGGIHVTEDQAAGTREDTDGDLSYCITANYTGPFTGCCCAVDSGQKRATTADDCVGTYDVWTPDLPCSAVTCIAEQWACCETSGCALKTLANCTGQWYRFYVCNSTDPGYDATFWGEGIDNVKICPAIPPDCPITCDSPAAFSRGLTGGYLYISWDRGEGARRYVIDNFTGFSGSINRMKWWGNSCNVWDGPDCDFAQPAPFAIRFYHSVGSPAGPDCENPSKVYDPIDVEWIGTGYYWTGNEETYGEIDCYIAMLPTTYSPGTGTQWVSIAAKDPDCDYIWAPGANGTSGVGQWFYDNGVCEAQPGLRHRSFCLHTNVRSGACCNELTGLCANSTLETACTTTGGTFYPAMRCIQIPSPGCYAHTGACCDHTGTGSCTITVMSGCTGENKVWLGKDTTCDECCVVYCPEGGTPEPGDPCSDGYVDPNPGCLADNPGTDDFTPIADGEVICGMAGTYDGDTLRDTDWYRYEMTDELAIIKAKVKGEFMPQVDLLVGQCFSDTWCSEEVRYTLTYSTAAANPCEFAVASAPLQGPNFYYIFVSLYGMAPCTTPYTLEIEKDPAGCCHVGEDQGLTSEAYCLALGGTWEEGVPCGGVPPCKERADSNCDDLVNGFDIDPFVLALTNPDGPGGWAETYGDQCQFLCANDINCDGLVNGFDIDPFVQCLTGNCPPCP
jgi:hypothetical protein